jgi:hypothetical protein
MTTDQIITEEPIETAAGTYTLRLNQHSYEHEPRWMFINPDGSVRCGGHYKHRHENKSEALDYLQAEVRIQIATADMPGTLGRTQYEDMCQKAERQPLGDQEIASGYGITYGEFTYPDYSADHIVDMKLARARQHGIREEQAAQAVPRPTPDIISCPNCGQHTYRGNLMNASLGTACPECYDDLSG